MSRQVQFYGSFQHSSLDKREIFFSMALKALRETQMHKTNDFVEYFECFNSYTKYVHCFVMFRIFGSENWFFQTIFRSLGNRYKCHRWRYRRRRRQCFLLLNVDIVVNFIGKKIEPILYEILRAKGKGSGLCLSNIHPPPGRIVWKTKNVGFYMPFVFSHIYFDKTPLIRHSFQYTHFE